MTRIAALIVRVLLVAALLGACAPEGRQAGSVEAAAVPAGWEGLLPNPRLPMEGVLSGGQPSLEQLTRARELGFRTVVNLRVDGEPGTAEEPARVEDLGMAYVSLPVRGAEGLTEANARALSSALAAAERPVLLHCGSGNRVGGLLALEAFYLRGSSAEEALDLGVAAGLTRLEPAVREHLETAAGR